MNRSYKKVLRYWAAHARSDKYDKHNRKKCLRQKLSRLCDMDGTPVLPNKIGNFWPVGKRMHHSWYNKDDLDITEIKRIIRRDKLHMWQCYTDGSRGRTKYPKGK